MIEQMTIDGVESLGPPRVPPAVLLPAITKTMLPKSSDVACVHCQMIAVRVAGHKEPHPPWTRAAQITVLRSVFRITQVDGSTLNLCRQHTTEHLERGQKR